MPVRKCHYCKGVATTTDHIVPRSRYVGLVRPNIKNTVPACGPCNTKKGNNRSNCFCFTCETAWTFYGPVGWSRIRIVNLRKA